MRIIACDPGKGGGLAEWNGKCADAHHMPDSAEMVLDFARLRYVEGAVWYQEQILKTTGKFQTGAMTATYAQNGGIAEGIARGLGYRVELIWPQSWQAALSTGTKRVFNRDATLWKNHLKEMAQKFFPNLKVTLHTADALLLLHYAIMKETGTGNRHYA